jgi:hypothetical protein
MAENRAADEHEAQKNAASPKGSGVFDHDT